MDGPTFYDRELAPVALQRLLAWVNTQYASHGLSHVRCRRLSITNPISEEAFVTEAFESAGFRTHRWATYLVDLCAKESARWDALHRAARKNIRKCRREQVQIRRLESFHEFQTGFYEPYTQAETDAGRSVGPLQPYRDLFELDTEGYYSFLVAETRGGQPLATLGMYCVSGTATEIASSTLPLAATLRLPAQDILHWEAMAFAAAAGNRVFDLAGVAPIPSNPKEEGIRRFKEKWGGSYQEYMYYHKGRLRSRLVRDGWALLSRIRRGAF
jgi:hypothetical protein